MSGDHNYDTQKRKVTMYSHQHSIAISGSADDIKGFVDGFGQRRSGIIGGDDRRCGFFIWLGDVHNYCLEKCHVGIFSIDTEFKMGHKASESLVAVYDSWTAAYPELDIMWRYYFNMGLGCGYIDKCGNHVWHQDKDGNWVAEDTNMPAECMPGLDACGAAWHALNFCSPATIRQIALAAINLRQTTAPFRTECEDDRHRFELTWAYAIMRAVTGMVQTKEADDFWLLYRQQVTGLETRDSFLCKQQCESYRHVGAAGYVFEPLSYAVIKQIAKDAITVHRHASIARDSGAALKWADEILCAAGEVLPTADADEIERCLQQVKAGGIADLGDGEPESTDCDTSRVYQCGGDLSVLLQSDGQNPAARR